MGSKSRMFEDMNEYSVLSKKEEEFFAKQTKSKNKAKAKEAFDKMVLCNIGLVVKIAHEFRFKGVPFEDIVSEGVIGLMKAVDHYKPTKGAKFSTYAAYWIKEMIRRYIISSRGVIRLPRKVPSEKYHYERLRLEGKSDEEIMKLLGHGKEFLWELKNRTRIYSLDEEIDEGKPLGERLPAQENNYDYEADNLINVIYNSKHLSYPEKIVLIYRYGLNGAEAIFLSEIAQFFGRSKERIRQLEEMAIDKLRKEVIK